MYEHAALTAAPNETSEVPAVKYYSIDETTARISHQMMSMSDYPKNRATNEYRAAVDEAAALVECCKAATSPYYHDKLDALLDRYARRLAQWTNDHNRNGASCPSVTICGPANFPTRKKEKQIAREDSLWREYNEIKAILDKIRSIGTGPVDLADPHAREILTDRLNNAKTAHEAMKGANTYYHKHKTLDGCPGIDEKTREWLTRPGVFACGTPLDLYKTPYPSHSLQSSSANIKRIQARLDELDKLQAAQADPIPAEEHDGFRLVRNAEQNRLQIIFDGKPDEATRSLLKSNGFRWAPSQGAWQRQLTPNAEYAAKRVVKQLC